MNQELSSTVKHVNWAWPDCLVGNGPPGQNKSSLRVSYNISIHQSFRLNGSDYYTVFDLPISVTNSIPSNLSSSAGGNDPAPGPLNSDGSRVSCGALQNTLMDSSAIANSTKVPSTQPSVGGPVSVGAIGKVQNAAVRGIGPVPWFLLVLFLVL